MFLKLAFGKEIHILNKENPTLEQIYDFINGKFKKVPKRYTLTYIDEDDDEITINNEDDVKVFLQLKAKSVKIYIKEMSE